jgi:hypothetical protein
MSCGSSAPLPSATSTARPVLAFNPIATRMMRVYRTQTISTSSEVAGALRTVHATGE